MSNVSASEQSPAHTASAQIKAVPPNGPVQGKRGRWVQRSRLALILYLLMLPTLAGMVAFIFVPQFSAVQMSLFTWDGDTVQEYIGFKNFKEAFTQDSTFWACFQLVGILLMANLVKMWPSILTAVVLHRIRSERAQYLYRVFFVVPMIIPGLVMLLMWKSFYDPTIGILNIVLNKTGLMHVLLWLDQTMPGVSKSAPAVGVHKLLGNSIGGVWGVILFAAVLLSVRPGLKAIAKGYFWWVMLAAISFAYFVGVSDTLAVALLRWIITLGVGLGLSALAERMNRDAVLNAAKIAGGVLLTAGVVLLLTTMIWTEPTGKPVSVFSPVAEGLGASPNWLGNPKLIIPAIIFWGFPWIGTVGVLIYLAGLESITTDVYEAAELDGVGSIRKLFAIELPLIMTQVRINLIFMTIGTLSDYGLMLLLLGPEGGPGRKGMVPGLYAYRAAFIDGRFGYACALGMVMFFIILFITIVYQKYVRVEK